MKRFTFAILVASATTVPLQAQTPLPPPAPGSVDYEQDVKPILAQHCYACHGLEVQQAGLRLDARQNALRGGDYGPVIVAGKSSESKLIRRLVDGDGGLQMPPTGALLPEQIGILRAWIDQGADFRNDVQAEAAPPPLEPRLAQLIAAVRSQPRERVEALLANDGDLVHSKDPAGSTLLHHAAGFGRVETLALLLDRGIDVNAKNRRGSTALHWAVPYEPKVRLLLARGAVVHVKQIEGRTPLYQAAFIGNGASVLRLLLGQGADPNAALANGRTPLMAAAARGDIEVMRLLVDAKAQVDARNGAGETALILAAAYGEPGPVQFLIDRGADVRTRTKRDETALGNASTAGSLDTVRLLLDRGADVNGRNVRGHSPLLLAASSEAAPASVVKLLLAKGADQSVVGDYNETARDLAAKRGNHDVIRLLGGPATAASAAPARHRAALRSIPVAVESALAMLEKQSYTFIRTGGCNSCHSQDLPSGAAAFARSRGLRAPAEVPQLPQPLTGAPERLMDLNIISAPGTAWELFDYGLNGVPRNAYTDAAVHAIKAMQNSAGYWPSVEGRRPPMNAGEFQAAALGIYALKHYTPEGDESSTTEALRRAVAWLERAHPQTTQDRAFHALALVWADPGSESARRAARMLLAMQRPDGGWSQLPGLESDAYATGQALFALATAGKIGTDTPAYQKGVKFLLATQADDGTWHVKSRAIWFQPYFESGFPYGRDQFISAAGSAWAVMALTAATSSATTTTQGQ